MIRWKEVALGAVSFLGAHLAQVIGWRQWFDPAALHAPWFLNSGRAVAFTAIWLFLTAAAAAAFTRTERRETLVRAANVAAGAGLAMLAVLFATGPGTLFPIVIVIGGAIIAASAVAGGVTGWRLTHRHPADS